MSHITDEQRCTIQRMKEAGYQQKQIAVAIGKSDSSVSRELRRNRDERNAAYRADLAARKSAKRKKAKPKAVRFTATMRLYVEERLALKYSPEQIVGVARQEGLDLVSHERITSTSGRTRSMEAAFMNTYVHAASDTVSGSGQGPSGHYRRPCGHRQATRSGGGAQAFWGPGNGYDHRP
jgi:IS30 family transposase